MSATVSIASLGGDRIDVSDAAFGREFNEGLVHQAVVAFLAGARTGSKAQKSRGEVRGGGRKPWRQKRTGRARAGSIRSPIWRGGGRAFAAKPQDHSVKLNRKMYRGAVRCIFSELIRRERLAVVSAADLSLEAPKTKLLAGKLAGWPGVGDGTVLIIVGELERNLDLAARNLPHVDVRDAEDLDPVVLLGAGKVFVEANALKAIEERLA